MLIDCAHARYAYSCMRASSWVERRETEGAGKAERMLEAFSHRGCRDLVDGRTGVSAPKAENLSTQPCCSDLVFKRCPGAFGVVGESGDGEGCRGEDVAAFKLGRAGSQ